MLHIRKKDKTTRKKKEARVENEKDLKRKYTTGETENVKRQKMAVKKIVETLRKNIFSEAIVSDGNRDHAVKTASFVKTLAEKDLL